MEIIIIILLVVLVCALAWFMVEVRHIVSDLKNKLSSEQSLLMLQQQMAQVRDTLNVQMEVVRKQLAESGKTVEERLLMSSTVFGEVKKEIGGLSRAAEQIFVLGKDISSLQELLRSPKLRGGFGEYLLIQLLRQSFPGNHVIEQYTFKTGEIVDAVIKIGDKLLPIDAKFPLENFKQFMNEPLDENKQKFRKAFLTDVKKHINSIAAKYIVPGEGTFDFALMYIPAENVYYELIAGPELKDSIQEISFSKKVFPVSPSTLFAHLQIILLGLKGLHVDRNARLILERMLQLKCDVDRLVEDFSVAGKHLNNLGSKFNETEKKLSRLSDRIGGSLEMDGSLGEEKS